MAGWQYENGVATLWKNGVLQHLSDGEDAKSVFVSGQDVYVAGQEDSGNKWSETISGIEFKWSINIAILWKNGKPQRLTNGKYDAHANAVSVKKAGFYHHMPLKPLILVPLLIVFGCQAPQVRTEADGQVKVYFTSSDSPTAAIIEVLDNAKQTVHVQAYSFTSALIAAALKRAYDRGVAVRVILDKSQVSEKYSSATFLKRAGIAVWIDSKHAIAHNKVMIVDGRTVITGSFNFTKNTEERNAENLLVINDERIANQYLANWGRCKGHSEEYL
jgi:phosphatidylserine/phosphatidylglycerophosphate/cardiolipin synthase-like enzyme